MSGEAAKERVTPVPSKYKLLMYRKFQVGCPQKRNTEM